MYMSVSEWESVCVLYLQGNSFGRNAEPHLVAQFDSFVKAPKHFISAVPILSNILRHICGNNFIFIIFPFHGACVCMCWCLLFFVCVRPRSEKKKKKKKRLNKVLIVYKFCKNLPSSFNLKEFWNPNLENTKISNVWILFLFYIDLSVEHGVIRMSFNDD